jgi:hypothetical protein
MVRYPFDRFTVLSSAEGLTTNGKLDGYMSPYPFALRYRRAKRDFCKRLYCNILVFCPDCL